MNQVEIPEEPIINYRQQARANVLRSQMKAVEDKRFYCDDHDVAYRDSTRLNRHLNGRKHHPELYLTYKCEACNYTTKQKFQYNRHILTNKHRRNSQ